MMLAARKETSDGPCLKPKGHAGRCSANRRASVTQYEECGKPANYTRESS